MPKSKFVLRNKSGNAEVTASYRVVGSITDLTSEQKDQMVLTAIRTLARTRAMAQLKTELGSIALNRVIYNQMIADGLMEPAAAKAFFRKTGSVVDFSDNLEFKIGELIGDSTRGRKAADPFEFEGDDEAEEPEEVKPEEPKKNGKGKGK
jgi:hypothetical protein